jgi:hypothetical protein
VAPNVLNTDQPPKGKRPIDWSCKGRSHRLCAEIKPFTLRGCTEAEGFFGGLDLKSRLENCVICCCSKIVCCKVTNAATLFSSVGPTARKDH